MSANPKTIMLVEDDQKLACATKEYLESRGFKVIVEFSGLYAVDRILEHSPDCVILDYMLAGKDGKQICKELRPLFEKPIIVLTAHDDEIDQIVTLELGADDYLLKPVAPRHLLVRINNLIQLYERLSNTQSSVQQIVNAPSTGIVLEQNKRMARLNDQKIKLTSTEFDLLNYLFKNQGVASSREDIYKAVFDQEWDGLDRRLDFCISKLRTKLGDDAQNQHYIKSVRGIGYLFTAQ